MSPTARTQDYLRKRGWLVGITEKFVRFPPPGHRQDLFGFADLVAIRYDDVAFIQACAGASHATRLAKVLTMPDLPNILGSPCRHVWIFSWRKSGERGKRKTWQPRIDMIGATHMNAMEIEINNDGRWQHKEIT